MISTNSLSLLANSDCINENDEKLTCVSGEEIEGIFINYDTSPVSIDDFKALIEFTCSPKAGSTNEWTIDYLEKVDTLVPDFEPESFDYSSCNYTDWARDPYCDDVTNNPECNFDNGACCLDNVKKTYCLECECKGVPSRSLSSNRVDSSYGMLCNFN